MINGKYLLLCGNVTIIPSPSLSFKSARRISAPSIISGRIVEETEALDAPADIFSIKLIYMSYLAYQLCLLNLGS